MPAVANIGDAMRSAASKLDAIRFMVILISRLCRLRADHAHFEEESFGLNALLKRNEFGTTEIVSGVRKLDEQEKGR